MKVRGAVGGEVLDQSPVPDHGEEGVDVRGEVHVQHQVVLHLLQQLPLRVLQGCLRLSRQHLRRPG